MSTAKEALWRTIETLSEEEAAEVLQWIRNLQDKRALTSVLRRLAQDPTFTVPQEIGGFPPLVPLQGKGRSASSLLIQDRR
jgi:hypothetical protein